MHNRRAYIIKRDLRHLPRLQSKDKRIILNDFVWHLVRLTYRNTINEI